MNYPCPAPHRFISPSPFIVILTIGTTIIDTIVDYDITFVCFGWNDAVHSAAAVIVSFLLLLVVAIVTSS